MFKKIFLIVSFFLSFSALAETLDKVIAVVNYEPITQSELTQQMGIAKDQLLAAGLPVPSEQKLRTGVLDQLIDMKLQLQLAKKEHMTVSDEKLDKTIAQIAAKNNMTVSQLKIGIAQHNMHYATYREQIRREMLLSEIEQSQVGPRIKITPQEVNDMIEQLKRKGATGNLENQAKQLVFEKKYQAAMKTWLSAIRSQAYVKIIQD